MRKLLLLFFALLTGVGGAWADTSISVSETALTDVSQISTSKYYVLYNQGRGAYINVRPTTGQVLLTSTLPATDTELLPFIIRFVPNANAKSEGDAYQLKFYDGTYLPWQSNGSANYVTKTMGYASASNEAFLPVYNESYFYFQVYKDGSSRAYYFNGNELSEGIGSFTFWGSSTGNNSQYQIYEAECDDFQEVSYKFSYESTTTSNNSNKLLTVKNATIARPTNTALDSSPSYVGDSWVNYAITAPSDGSDITFSITYPFVTTTISDGEFASNSPLYRLKGNVGNTPTYIKNSSNTIIYKTDGDVTNDDYFCFTGNPFDGFKIYNVGAGPSINVGSDTPTQGTAPDITSSEHIWRIFANNTKYGMQQVKTGETNLSNAYFCNVGGVFTYWISGWAVDDGGARMDIEPVDFDVTYKVLLTANGDPVATGVESKTTGGDMALNVASTSAGRAFCKYKYYSDQACTDEISSTVFGGISTVYALVSFEMPFSTNTDKYYYMTLRDHYVYYDETNNDVRTNQSSWERTDAYRWSFSGDPYNGIKVKNKQTGTYLDNTSSTVQLTTEGYAWTLKRLDNTNTFGLYNGSNHINEQNHTNHNLIYWWQFEDDNGSQFKVEDVEFIPDANNFYRIKAGVSEKYITGNPSSYNSFLALSEEADISTIIYYAGGKLLNYSKGLYSKSTSGQAAVGEDGDSYTIALSSIRPGFCTIYSTTSSQYMYDSGNTANRGCVDRQGGLGGKNTDWKFEKVTTLPVTISSAGYATFCSPVAVTIPSGVKAYTGIISGESLLLSEVLTTIPANTAVVLEGDAGEYSFALTTSEAFDGANDLKGTIAAITWPASGTTYTLQENKDDSGTVGFYTTNVSSIPGFKAYLNTDASVKGFTFDFETAIKALEAAKNPAKMVYDMNGRRVENPTKGLYIVSGKKVVIK